MTYFPLFHGQIPIMSWLKELFSQNINQIFHFHFTTQFMKLIPLYEYRCNGWCRAVTTSRKHPVNFLTSQVSPGSVEPTDSVALLSRIKHRDYTHARAQYGHWYRRLIRSYLARRSGYNSLAFNANQKFSRILDLHTRILWDGCANIRGITHRPHISKLMSDCNIAISLSGMATVAKVSLLFMHDVVRQNLICLIMYQTDSLRLSLTLFTSN